MVSALSTKRQAVVWRNIKEQSPTTGAELEKSRPTGTITAAIYQQDTRQATQTYSGSIVTHIALFDSGDIQMGDMLILPGGEKMQVLTSPVGGHRKLAQLKEVLGDE